ncbi:MAG: xanthine dehydrogenase family protein molybdopterin-binding subunit [Verrucomicrobia bacterium]|nr:xanthine dehydrogenase family protein molybdopterin-binding subunit [Verrucomicrobiota bacterium]
MSAFSKVKIPGSNPEAFRGQAVGAALCRDLANLSRRKATPTSNQGEATSGWSRRAFLKTFTGGLAVVWLLDSNDARAQAESGGKGRGGGRGGQRRPTELAAWLHIAADGAITVFTGKAEVGQNIRTSLTQAVAEELPAPLAAIKLVMGDTSLTPWDSGTAGSRTTPDMNLQLRKVAATAREALLDLAAKNWQVDRGALTAAEGKIRHPASNRAIGFGELTKGEKLVVAIADTIALKPATAWKIAGTSVPKIDGRKYVNGRHAYASDVQRPGLVHGRVLRPGAFEATLVSLDASAAESMPGVTVVRDGSFVGVTAPTEHQAAQALAALRAEWKSPPQVSERGLFAHLKSTARNAPPPAAAGPAEPGTLRQSYTVAYIAHAPLEPRAGVAEWQGDQLTVWTGSQRPFGVRGELVTAFGIPEERIRVIVPDTGSGYGGKHTGEAAVEAARLAKAAGKPVKLVWTREEEFTWAYFRPAGLIEINSAVSADGRITSWEHHNYNSGGAAIRALYDVPGQRAEFHAAKSPLRTGSYRALAATANHFARETHIDELARSAKIDPLEFRLKNLSDPRARAVLEAAAKAFGWNTRARTAGHGAGLAVGFDKNGYVATVAEIAIDRATGKVAVRRVVESFDCGAVVNPDHLKNQIEGAIVQGLGGALFEAVRFENGRILNPNFTRYRVPRFSDTPAIEIVLLDRKDLPSAGGGEAPIVGIAPAVGNAIFDAVGVRLRSLPLVPNGLRV